VLPSPCIGQRPGNRLWANVECLRWLAAQVPWEECEHPYQLVHQVVEQGRRPPLPTTCEPALAVLPSVCELIQQCWHTDPEQRPAFAAVVERLHVLTAAVVKEVRSAPLHFAALGRR
jgi:hypothetical protein